jgi:hypothetical protein
MFLSAQKSAIHMRHELEAMRKSLVIRNYATKTVGTYVSVIKRSLAQLDKPVQDVTPADIQEWQYFLANHEKVSLVAVQPDGLRAQVLFPESAQLRLELRAHPVPAQAQKAADHSVAPFPFNNTTAFSRNPSQIPRQPRCLAANFLLDKPPYRCYSDCGD